MTQLFSKDSVFVSNADSKEAVLTEVSEALVKAGYVKDNFLEHVLDREKKLPNSPKLIKYQ